MTFTRAFPVLCGLVVVSKSRPRVDGEKWYYPLACQLGFIRLSSLALGRICRTEPLLYGVRTLEVDDIFANNTPHLGSPNASQSPASDSTAIPGIVEPLELRGEPQGLTKPSELQRRLGDALPKSNDVKELKRAMESLDAIIQQYPNSTQALSTRLTLSCEIKSKDAKLAERLFWVGIVMVYIFDF